MHDYEIRRDGASARFLVDGRQVHATGEAPTAPLRAHLNAWYPAWLEPADPPAGGELVVERYEYAP